LASFPIRSIVLHLRILFLIFTLGFIIGCTERSTIPIFPKTTNLERAIPAETSITLSDYIGRKYSRINPNTVDFGNFEYSLFAGHRVVLSDGAYEQYESDGGWASTNLKQVVRFENATVVHIVDASGSGSSICSEYLLFFARTGSTLTLTHTLSYRCSYPLDTPGFFREGDVRILAYPYVSDLGNCCPRYIDEAHFEISKDAIVKATGWKRWRNPKYAL
jgi:hypothetical protein